MNNVISKAFIGLLFLVIFLGAVLFISAGTLNYWEGWVYILVFFLCCAVITVYLVKTDMGLLKRRLNAGPGGEKEKSQKMRCIIVIVQLARSIKFLVGAAGPYPDVRCNNRKTAG